MDIRVGIAGSAGTGKSLLAKDIADKLGVQYISSKRITRPILERLGYRWDGSMQVEEFLANEQCQEEILDLTEKAHAEAGNFVTDRTFVDIAAYTIAMNTKNVDFIERIECKCFASAKNYTDVILCP